MGAQSTTFAKAEEIECIVPEPALIITKSGNYKLYITHHYATSGPKYVICITSKVSDTDKLLTNDRRVVDRDGKEAVFDKNSRLHCIGYVLVQEHGIIDDIFAPCLCLVRSDGKFTVITPDKTVRYISTKETCFVEQTLRSFPTTANSDLRVTPFEDKFKCPEKQEYLYDRGLLREYLLKYDSSEIQASYDKFVERICDGTIVDIKKKVHLQLDDGEFVIHPIVFGWTVHQRSPLRKVDGFTRESIPIELTISVLRKVLLCIMSRSYPNFDHLDANVDLIENCVLIHRALDYLGIMYYAEFFQGLSIVTV
jgi:hypothetical protein